jgi:hypothetical protein
VATPTRLASFCASSRSLRTTGFDWLRFAWLIAAIRAFGVPQVPAWRIGFVPHIRFPSARDRMNRASVQASERAPSILEDRWAAGKLKNE